MLNFLITIDHCNTGMTGFCSASNPTNSGTYRHHFTLTDSQGRPLYEGYAEAKESEPGCLGTRPVEEHNRQAWITGALPAAAIHWQPVVSAL